MKTPRPVIALPYVFLSEPYAPRGYWIRTDASVAFAACPFCKAAIGEPCRKTVTQKKPDGGYETRVVESDHKRGTHVDRRKAAQEAKPVVQVMTWAKEVEEHGNDVRHAD